MAASTKQTIHRKRGEDNRTNVLPVLEELYLFGEITDAGAAETVRRIEEIRQRSGRLRMWICSLGGDLGGALAIHDALQRYPGSEAIATGNCQSAALVAFLGAERRFCTPNTIFLNHDIVGAYGEIWPSGMHLPVVVELGAIRRATFGPDLAREFGIVEWPPSAEKGAAA